MCASLQSSRRKICAVPEIYGFCTAELKYCQFGAKLKVIDVKNLRSLIVEAETSKLDNPRTPAHFALAHVTRQCKTTLAVRAAMNSLYDIDVTTIDGKPLRLDAYRGQVLLIVNVASRCGFTPQYAGLEALYRKYKADGFTVLGFPCDQFAHQEPGNEAEIKDFCRLTYDVTFPLFAKINVNGPNTHPLYEHLKSARRGFLGSKAIKWNFTKFLVDRRGNIVRRCAPSASPESIEIDLKPLLSQSK